MILFFSWQARRQRQGGKDPKQCLMQSVRADGAPHGRSQKPQMQASSPTLAITQLLKQSQLSPRLGIGGKVENQVPEPGMEPEHFDVCKSTGTSFSFGIYFF